MDFGDVTPLKQLFAELLFPQKKEPSGIMIALYLPLHIQQDMALEGGEKAEDLHVTLAYLPKVGDDEAIFTKLTAALKEVAADFSEVEGWIGGMGRFVASEQSDGMEPYYASFNSPVLPALHADVLSAIESVGLEPSRVHGFTPHVTLAYLDGGTASPKELPSSEKFKIPYLSIASRKIGTRHIPLTGDRVLKADPSGSQVHVNVPLGSEDEEVDATLEDQMLGAAIGKAEEPELFATIKKADRHKQIVYCVVLEPHSVDAQDDWMVPEDIEKTAHEYLMKSRAIGADHNRIIDAHPVESYIAPQDLVWEGGPYGDQIVKKGSWVLGVKVNDKKMWEKLASGDYQGFSVSGLGLRT